jgi:hypothetical protein
MSPLETVEIGEAFDLVVDLAVIVVFGVILDVVPELVVDLAVIVVFGVILDVVPELVGATVLGAVGD